MGSSLDTMGAAVDLTGAGAVRAHDVGRGTGRKRRDQWPSCRRGGDRRGDKQPRTTGRWLHASALATGLVFAMPVAAQTTRQPTAATPATENTEGTDIVVTGNVTGTRSAPSVAVSVIDARTLQAQVPVSAADLLRNVPSVFVNSAFGEVRNIVYSRGVSANSSEAAAGYYYVSLQEDGLPVTNVTATNYSPDFFLRQDINLSRLEALRGGTAVVTGPNAPGGIFNYISRDGKSDPGVELRGRVGLLGNGRNAYYRGDAYAGGKLSDNFYYGIGGFYRWDRGSRDPGYAFNKGGEIKGNLLFDYGRGSVKVYGKYLDDHNSFYEFLPATNFDSPTILSPLSVYDSFLPPASGAHSYTPFNGAAQRTWNPTNLAHAKAWDVGFRLNHDFGDGWSFTNDFKVADNNVVYNTGAVIFPLPVTDIVLNSFLNTLAPGTYSFRNPQTGALVLQVNRTSPLAATIPVNNLPAQNVVTNGVISQVAYDYQPQAREVFEQAALTKAFDTMRFRVGGFYARSHYRQFSGTAGIGVSPIQTQPYLFNITYTNPAGVAQQVTSPEGYTGIGQRLGGTQADLVQTQVSAFAGHNWDITDHLNSDLGVRYESISVKGFTQLTVPVTSATGGLDGNANTLFDNISSNLSAPLNQSTKLDFFSFSGALTYKFDQHNSLFGRYSTGKKAPDLSFFTTLTSAGAIANVQALPQTVTQVEFGFRHRSTGVRLSINPFYSLLSQVRTQQLFTNADGTTYVPVPLPSSQRTYGLEIEGNFDLTSTLNLNIAGTVQKATSRNFAIYVANAPGPADDTITRVPDGEADNTPQVFGTTTVTWRPIKAFSSFISWKYLGSRQANRYNTFKLPAFSQFDLGASFDIGPNFSINANVNNALNSKGVFSWSPAGGLLASLDRQSFTPAQLAANPGQTFNIVTVQPRAMFVGATVKF